MPFNHSPSNPCHGGRQAQTFQPSKPHSCQQASRRERVIIWNLGIWNLDRDVSSSLIPINKPRAGALGSLTECQHFVDLLKAVSKPRAGALGSLTECPLDIRPFRVCELTHAGRSATYWGRAVRGRISNTPINERLPEIHP